MGESRQSAAQQTFAPRRLPGMVDAMGERVGACSSLTSLFAAGIQWHGARTTGGAGQQTLGAHRMHRATGSRWRQNSCGSGHPRPCPAAHLEAAVGVDVHG